MRHALVTGGNGFLGSYVVRDLLNEEFESINILMRGTDALTCEQRLRSLWWERPEIASEVGKRIKAVPGDITLERLGLDDESWHKLASDTSHIVHAAAEIGVNETSERFGAVNIDGTQNMLLFASAAQKAGGLERLVHISTAYVAGTREGLITEDELADTTFNSLYEQSKHGAEQLVRDCADRLPIAIVRPAQIVGDSRTGFAATFNTLYYPLKLYLKGQLGIVPASKTQKVNMVPVDYVSRMIVQALLQPQAVGKTFHAVIPAEHQPSAGELLDSVRSWAKTKLDFDPGTPRFINAPGAASAGRRRNMAAASAPKPKSFLQNMLALAPYFSETRNYSTANAESLLGHDWPDWREYLPQLLAYATHKGFLNHTGRTVFEQMLVRLSSPKNTLAYYDVSRQGISRLDATEAKDAILRTASALTAQGIRAGDRVVLVGVNSTRYFIADAAVGLLGATGVPLYYTSPTADIVELSRRCEAKLAFVGTQKLLDELPGKIDIPLVSLLDTVQGAASAQTESASEQDSKGEAGCNDTPENAASVHVTSWGDFLKTSSSSATPLPSVPFDSAATIRCTSGTTGIPKGVVFDHYQLRWMAEVMPTLLDWRTRNRKLRYLSFLPMSHVVEGILVAYAPYYILSDIEMFYLNDFDALTDALPKVRPTLFFSVPRFYEKLWGQFEASSAGQRYLTMAEGTAKRAFGRIARTILLRRAGLDQCRQLIVGSAPVSMELLENFRALGIEIHNAYGVTEAPLIALSRLGQNELGSVGALLPDTTATLSSEGEILVAGPQVAKGYDGLGSCCNEQGFFETGDFGSWSEAGHLIIGGRKKELVVTSYGKNISPEKVETLLKGIPGVSEALLVGEARPYVCALLWLEDEAHEGFDAAALDAEVLRRNTQLSHPEQVKRWAVMDARLSIATGELTPNLKLRRSRVAELNNAVVDALYGETFRDAPGTLHVGAQP